MREPNEGWENQPLTDGYELLDAQPQPRYQFPAHPDDSTSPPRPQLPPPFFSLASKDQRALIHLQTPRVRQLRRRSRRVDRKWVEKSTLLGNGNLKRDSYRTTQRVAYQNEVWTSGLAERVIIAFLSSVTNGKMTEFRWRLVIGSRGLADAEKGSREGRPNANATQTRTRSHTRREPALEIRHTFHFLKRLRFPQ